MQGVFCINLFAQICHFFFFFPIIRVTLTTESKRYTKSKDHQGNVIALRNRSVYFVDCWGLVEKRNVSWWNSPHCLQ